MMSFPSDEYADQLWWTVDLFIDGRWQGRYTLPAPDEETARRRTVERHVGIVSQTAADAARGLIAIDKGSKLPKKGGNEGGQL